MAVGGTVCAFHKRRPRVATCASCGRALCADCIVRTGVGIKCRSCTGVKATKPAKAEEAEREAVLAAVAPTTTSARRPAGGGRTPWAVPLVAAGVVVLLVAGYGLLSRDSGTKAPRQVQTATAPEITERVTEFVGANGLRIGGTLTVPPLADGSTAPAVLIIPGLGALDRNGLVSANPPDALRDALVSTVGGVGLSPPDPLFKDLSETLANAGVASFRYEKRGTKGSPLPSGQKLSFDDDVTDARAALEVLSKRAEIGASPIVLLGQDAGAIVAMRLSVANPRIKGVVALSLPAKPLGDVLAADLARTRGAAAGDAMKAAVAALASTGTAPPADTLPEILRPIFAPGQDAYLKSLFALDPPTEIFKVPVSVLQVRGGTDPSVTAADTDRLSTSIRTSGQVMVGASDTDHNLAFAGPGHEHSNVATTPKVQRDTGVASAMTAWIKSTLTTS